MIRNETRNKLRAEEKEYLEAYRSYMKANVLGSEVRSKEASNLFAGVREALIQNAKNKMSLESGHSP
jgi:hypothetical protein